jgi:aromatic ring-opening dioxygenase catalytic subunit (LigB family)
MKLGSGSMKPSDQSQHSARMPVAFAPHGGGPWPFIKNPLGTPDEVTKLAAYLRSLRELPKTPPRAILMVSAHWEERVPTVMTAERPPMLYDYYGFPPEAYTVNWPAPGDPEVAARVRHLLEGAGFKTAQDPVRGFDHGAFVPLKLAYPDADIPTVQLSLKRGLDPNEHISMGRALMPLRDEGVFIIGSGMTFHNLQAFASQAAPFAEAFDKWLRETMALDGTHRAERLQHWSAAPAARIAQPREEHLLPLMIIAGAAGDDRARVGYNGTILNLRLSAYHFG